MAILNPNQNNFNEINSTHSPVSQIEEVKEEVRLVRIVLADDHTVLRDGLAHLLNTEDDFEVVGVAGDGLEAIKLVLELKPDVILMDLQMPRLSGVEAIRRLQESHSQTKVIILTTFDTDEYIFEGIQAGAKGYLLKDVGREELCRTIRLVSQGQTLTQPTITARLFKLLAQDNPKKSYVTTIMQKFNVTDRTEAAMYAVQKKIVKLED